jgi:RHS repeat-associated protein
VLKGSPAALVALVLAVSTACGPRVAGARTVVTDYTYNADGALTAITTSVDGNASTTKYLTWDNFVPDATDPSTGTVGIGNGRLVGWGSEPGVANLTDRFQFDRRDRLLSYSGGAASETYDYHADGMMSAASTPTDTLSFYYDNAENQHATNLHQASTDIWSGYLGRNRYLSDGTAQSLLTPRKDVACTYDAGKGTLQSYAYDAFGSSPDPVATGFDLHDNPFRYTGEYRDPLWGGYYLRARWYHPDLPSFLSRDPVAHLNRYAYGGGNPVMTVDPSGMSFKWYKSIGNPLGKFLGQLNSGVGGHFARLFLSPVMLPLQILADPNGFWQAIKHNKDGMDYFLAAGIASNLALDWVGGALGPANVMRIFAARIASENTLGLGQSVTAGADRGFKHFNWNTFAAGAESTVGVSFETRMLGGVGYHRFNLTGQQVSDMIEQLEGQPRETVFVFRRRLALPTDRSELGITAGPSQRFLRLPIQTSPIQESLHLGFYHEQLIAVGNNDFFSTEITGPVETVKARIRLATTQKMFSKLNTRDFEFVGTVENFDVRRGFTQNPLNFPTGRGPTPYRLFTNNCQHHAAAVRAALGF